MWTGLCGDALRAFSCVRKGGFHAGNEYSAQHHASPSVSHLRACGLGLEPNIDQQVWSLAADAWIPLIWCLSSSSELDLCTRCRDVFMAAIEV